MAQEALLPIYSKLASYYKWGDHGDEDELCGPMNKWGLQTTYVDHTNPPTHPPTHPCGSCMLIWWGGNDRLLEGHDIFKKGLGVLTQPKTGTFMHEMLKLLPTNTNGTSHPRHAHPFHDTPVMHTLVMTHPCHAIGDWWACPVFESLKVLKQGKKEFGKLVKVSGAMAMTIRRMQPHVDSTYGMPTTHVHPDTPPRVAVHIRTWYQVP
jgi:hypothetical protein